MAESDVAPVAQLRIEPQGWVVPLPPGQTVLEAAQAAGVRLPRSCRNGSCRACRCRVLAGQAHHRVPWPGLSAEELAEGWILPCVAESGASLVVEVPLAQRAPG